MRFAFLFTSLIFVSVCSEAQIDPSSAMLLNSSRTNAVDGGLDSGRYTVKPRNDAPRATSQHRTEPKPRVDDATVSATTTANTATPSPNPSPTISTSLAGSSVGVGTTQVAPVPSPTPIPVETSVVPQPDFGPQSPTFGPQDLRANQENHQDVTAGKPSRDERRLTMLDLSFAPGYIYNDSQSTFAPRNYFVNAPVMSMDATVWTSPNFGVHTSFTGTLNANVSDSLNNTRNASLSEQWFSVGAYARSFFGSGPLAPTLQFGLDYRDYEFNVPSDTVLRNKLTTTGLLLLLDAEFPTDHVGSWMVGGEFGPKLSHHESSNATDFRSGDSPQTTLVGVHVGGKYRFDHTHQVFWKMSYGVEKNLFSGSTTINDPIGGSPQTNVSVTDSFTLFQLGYTWSN